MAFNSEEYTWSNISVVLGGRPVGGITAVKFKTKREVKHIYAKGTDPYTRTKGNKEYTGSIKLLQSEIEALLEAAGTNKDLTDLTFDIIVVFASETGGLVKTHILENCDVEDFEMGMEQGGSNMEVELPIKIGKIKYNV